jgi:hypothetical protein
MLKLAGKRRPRNRLDDRDARRLDVCATATVWRTIEIRFEIGSVNKGSNFVVMIDQGQFDGLAMEMIKADRDAATKAFHAALQMPPA